jgi:hypothetical protein
MMAKSVLLMPWDNNTRLRITPWPGIPLQLPDSRYRPYPLDGWAFGSRGGIWAPSNVYSSQGSYPALGESYLELAALDLHDDGSVRRFVERWGPLGVRWFQDPVSGEQIEDPSYSRIFGAPSLFETANPYDDQLTNLRDSIESASEEIGPDIWLVETMAEFRFGAGLIRDVLRAWRWQRDDVAPSEPWEFLPQIYGPETPDHAAELADDWTHGLLSAFYPQFIRVEVTATGETHRSAPYFSNVPLLSLMALELYNHACEAAEYKVCQNETCGRLFVRQAGRALHGQNRRAGVKYCTSECARAQAQRAYRRRRPRL